MAYVKKGGKRGPKPGSEAAKRGGRAVRDKYGLDFYSQIGHKGGSTVARQYRDTGFYQVIGKKGGNANKAKHDPEYFRRIGSRGGLHATKRERETAEQVAYELAGN